MTPEQLVALMMLMADLRLQVGQQAAQIEVLKERISSHPDLSSDQNN